MYICVKSLGAGWSLGRKSFNPDYISSKPNGTEQTLATSINIS